MNIALIRLSSFYDSQLRTTQFSFRSGKRYNDDICHQITPGYSIPLQQKILLLDMLTLQ